MLDQRTSFERHRLAHEGLAVRQSATTRGMRRHTTSQYLVAPAPPRPRRPRPRPLDPFTDASTHMVESDSKVAAVVLRQRLAAQGCTGGLTLVRPSRTRVRQAAAQQRAFSRVAAAPGAQCHIDWGPCGSLGSGEPQRKLDCWAGLAGHSRLLSRACTPSQRHETLHRCLLQACPFVPGTPNALVHDHRLTAGLERPGPRGRVNERLWEFLRPFHLTPVACQVAQPQDTGQVEKGAIHAIRPNFWPLRTLRALTALPAPANPGRDHVAHGRGHTTTGPPPRQRCDPKAMRS
jgi:transposase